VRRARVIAAYATVRMLDPVSGGYTVGGFYRDAILPNEADPEAVAALVRREYAEWVDGPKAEPVKAEPEPEKAPEKASEKEPEKAQDPERPAGNASQSAWAEYAVANGADPEAAAAMSRDELRAEFGG
jgi:predicted component of type VI protein secretion system